MIVLSCLGDLTNEATTEVWSGDHGSTMDFVVEKLWLKDVKRNIYIYIYIMNK